MIKRIYSEVYFLWQVFSRRSFSCSFDFFVYFFSFKFFPFGNSWRRIALNSPQRHLFCSSLSWQRHRNCVSYGVLYITHLYITHMVPYILSSFFFRLRHQQETTVIVGATKALEFLFHKINLFLCMCKPCLILYLCYYVGKKKKRKKTRLSKTPYAMDKDIKAFEFGLFWVCIWVWAICCESSRM